MRIYSLLLTLLFVFVVLSSSAQEITKEQQEIMNTTVYSVHNHTNIQADSIYYLYIEPMVLDRELQEIDTVDITDWINLESISMRARRFRNQTLIHQLFEKLEPQLTTLPNIKRVYFINVNLDKVPSAIFKIKSLETLYVQMNPIFSPTILFSGLDSLQNLSDLLLNECNLDYIPENIGNLTKLKKLNLSYNRLKELPASMRFLTELEELDISQNGFIEFPYVVLELKKLKKLSLNFNSPSSEEQQIPIPTWNGDETTLPTYEKELAEYETKIKEIRNNKAEKTLPKRIEELSLLTELSITGSQLKNLPEEIQHLNNLKKLSLNWSLFSEDTNLFEILKRLKKLDYLALEGNKFNFIPNQINSLTFLKALNLSNNKLTSLPESIKNLQNLENLYLFENNFSEEEKEKIKSWLPNTKIHFDYF